MSDYDKLLALVENDKVNYGVNLPRDLHKTLVLGQTRHVCRYGTLSDGHEKITPSQRYYQAIKEMYYLANSIKDHRAGAMEAQADLLDAQTECEQARKPSERLRAEAKMMRAKNSLTSAIVQVQDQLRMLDEYDRVRSELEPDVMAQYPEGIEQAERDNWLSVAHYRMIKQQAPGMAAERLDNLPLDPIAKAKFGANYGRLDAMAPLMVTNKEALKDLPEESSNNLLDFVEKVEQNEVKQ